MKKFRIVPWDSDFLPEAARLSLARPGAALIFPHDRPRRYMRGHFPEGRVTLLPPMLTGNELFRHLARALLPPLPLAETLDQAALLREAVLKCAPRNSVLRGLAKGELDAFLPWGLRLAELMEECFTQMVQPRNLPAPEAGPVADALLAALGDIRSVYESLLKARGLSTAGCQARDVALAVRAGADLAALPLLAEPPVLAGFVRLNGAEDALFRALWERGADVCLHSDPELLTGKAHWSCGDHAEWLTRWGAAAEPAFAPAGRKTALRFLAAGDLHSQLRVMRQDMDAASAMTSSTSGNTSGGLSLATSTAVALPRPALLNPVLHHLPEADLNISLGYPLERSQLGRLAELLLTAAESCHHWQAVLDVLRHPFVAGLREREGAPWLRSLEESLRRGLRLADVPALWEGLAANGAPQWFLNLEPVLFGNWRRAACLADLAFCLDELVALLLREGAGLWPRYPLDAESLFRLGARLAPGLRQLSMAREPLSFASLAGLLRQALARERVPFEADPITGLQVLGMLETRLLRFDRVYVPDLTEDNLPGAPERDPLLPESARPALGLPPSSSRRRLLAHTFFRLLAGADEAWLSWQEGVDSTGLFDSRKLRSPFVEELLWREEQTLGRLLKNGDFPLRSAPAFFEYQAPPRLAPLPRGPRIQAKMEEFLRHPLSATSLDAYLDCPLRFWQERVCGIRAAEEVNEGDDPGGLGRLVHAVLAEACRPFVGGEMRRSDLEDLPALFHRRLGESGLPASLPAQSGLMLEAAAPLRLARFVEQQPEKTRVILLESSLQAGLGELDEGQSLYGRDLYGLTLEGVVDRLDLRPEGMWVVDYKSGSLPRSKGKPWSDDALWTRMAEWLKRPELRADAALSAALLDDVADAFGSVQLPQYIYLCRKNGHAVSNAAWVRLAEDGAEVPLFAGTEDAECAFLLEERIPLLLYFVAGHVKLAPAFHARPGGRCARCAVGCPAGA